MLASLLVSRLLKLLTLLILICSIQTAKAHWFYNNPSKGYFSCRYIEQKTISIKWPVSYVEAPDHRPANDFISNIFVFRPIDVFPQDWKVSVKGNTLIKNEDEHVRFDLESNSIELLQDHETISAFDEKKIIAYYPNIRPTDKSLITVDIPEYGFYCVKNIYQLSNQTEYTFQNTRTSQTDEQYLLENMYNYFPSVIWGKKAYAFDAKHYFKLRMLVTLCVIIPPIFLLSFLSCLSRPPFVKEQTHTFIALFFGMMALKPTVEASQVLTKLSTESGLRLTVIFDLLNPLTITIWCVILILIVNLRWSRQRIPNTNNENNNQVINPRKFPLALKPHQVYALPAFFVTLVLSDVPHLLVYGQLDVDLLNSVIIGADMKTFVNVKLTFYVFYCLALALTFVQCKKDISKVRRSEKYQALTDHMKLIFETVCGIYDKAYCLAFVMFIPKFVILVYMMSCTTLKQLDSLPYNSLSIAHVGLDLFFYGCFALLIAANWIPLLVHKKFIKKKPEQNNDEDEEEDEY